MRVGWVKVGTTIGCVLDVYKLIWTIIGISGCVLVVSKIGRVLGV